MVDAFSRWCLFCHAEVHSAARNAPRVRFEDYAEDMIARSNRGEAFRIYLKDTRVARIANAAFIRLPNGNQAFAAVVTLGDRRGANPAFVDFERGDARDAERREGEVKGLSAHMLIEMTEDPDHVGRHRMLLEEVRGIGRTPISLLMRSELKAISTDRDERFRDPETGGNNQVRPVIEIWPEQSREMREALEKGRFTMVELYDTGRVAAFDEQPEFTVTRRTLKVKVEPAADGFEAALIRLKNLGRAEGYRMLKVGWRLPGGDAGYSEIHTDLEDVGTALLARRELIHVKGEMSECTHRLNHEFVEAMAAHFD